jgi:Cd2+/Zn2+-exporting ATPase
VDASESHVHLWYDPETVSLEHVEKLAHEAGIELRENYEHELFTLEGMNCPDCALTVEGAISRLPGVTWVSVNFPSSRMLVEYESPRVTRQAIARQVRKLGYRIAEPGVSPGRLARHAKGIGAAGCGLLALVAFVLSRSSAFHLAPWLYAAAVVSGGLPLLRGAFAALRTLNLDMNVLMVLAVSGAGAIGQWPEAAMVVLLFAVGGLLEARTSARSRRALQALLELSPERALVKTEGGVESRRAEELQPGDIFLLRPGDRVATDGVVTEGRSAVDQSPITGESRPVEKRVGEAVFAGTINLHGSLEVRATRSARENTLARITALLEAAQAQKSRTQRRMDRFARWYTPSVILLAAGLAILPPLLRGAAWEASLYQALALLVVSCPCALVIGVPVALVAGISAASREGLLVKAGLSLEQAARLRALAFDKTGTLTQGQPEVVSVRAVSGSAGDALALAAAAEGDSEHHLARAIRRHARRQGLAVPRAEGFEALPGLGARARVSGEEIYVGSPALFSQLGLELEESGGRTEPEEATEARTLVLVGTRERILAAITLGDRARRGARAVMEELRRLGLRRLVMLTGDHAPAAASIASEVGVDAWFAGLSPEEKIEKLRELRDEFGPVGMVGDGVNDAPALAASDVGFAMGAIGSDAALEAADIALMADDLRKLPAALRLSRRTASIITQNIALSLAIKLGLVALAFPGWLRLWLAVLGDTGASLLVILNAMRLLRVKRASGR